MAALMALFTALLLLSNLLPAAASGAVSTALEDSVDFLDEPLASPGMGGRRRLIQGETAEDDPSWMVPKHKPTATARLLASLSSSADPGDGGSPTSTLSQACRVELATMFADPTLCDASNMGQLCTDVMVEVLAWRVLCISGQFASRTASLFLPTTKGAKKAQWGSKGYLGHLGSTSGSKAVLGPVLTAITQNPDPARTLILFNWVSEMARLVYKKMKASPGTPTMITLGRAALRILKQEVTVVPPTAANATAPQARQAQGRSQFTQLAFVDNVLVGSGYTSDLQPIWPPQLWYEGSLRIYDFPTGSATSVFQESSSSSEIADSLAVSGSGEYNGWFGLKVSASASYMNSRLSSRTAYLATLAKRTYQVPDAVLGALQLSDLPKLNEAAAKDLSEQGAEFFALKYGVYFVHSVLYKAYADAWAQAYTSSTSSTTEVGAAVAGSFGGFSAEMETSWKSSRKDTDFQYSVITSSSFPCASRSFDKLEECSNDAIKDNAPGLGHKLILMRISDLPDYQRILTKPAPATPLQTPYELLGDRLKAEITKTWARAQYFLLTISKVMTTQEVQGGVDCGSKCFDKNVLRILQILSDLTANKELEAGGTKVFLAPSPTEKPRMRITKRVTKAYSVNLIRLNNKIKWASVGPGVLVTLFSDRFPESDEMNAFHMGEGSTKVEAFRSQYFSERATKVQVEYIADMDIDRKADLVDIMKKQLDVLESEARWSEGCRETAKGAVDSCPDGYFVQGVTMSPRIFEITSSLSCCKLPELGKKGITADGKTQSPDDLTLPIEGPIKEQVQLNCNGTGGGALNALTISTGFRKLSAKYSCLRSPGVERSPTKLTGCREVKRQVYAVLPAKDGVGCDLNERMTDFRFENVLFSPLGSFIQFDAVATCCQFPK